MLLYFINVDTKLKNKNEACVLTDLYCEHMKMCKYKSIQLTNKNTTAGCLNCVCL